MCTNLNHPIFSFTPAAPPIFPHSPQINNLLGIYHGTHINIQSCTKNTVCWLHLLLLLVFLWLIPWNMAINHGDKHCGKTDFFLSYYWLIPLHTVLWSYKLSPSTLACHMVLWRSCSATILMNFCGCSCILIYS